MPLRRPGTRTRCLWQAPGSLSVPSIAAAFPSTETEDNLFGETSDALRREAERTGVNVARSAVEGVAAAATEQGLSVEGLKKIGEDLTDKVRAVAERGVEAALGETKPTQANTQPGKSQL